MRGERAAGFRAGRLLPSALAAATAMAFASAGVGLRASECEDDETTPPTPTAVAVESVPVTVASTAADYFVLYVKNDVGNGVVREVPVSVTRGEEGATTLEWNLSGLPASRYRVEKYGIDDPGDVDGDCRDDLADPNPVNPARELELSDGLNLLSTSEQWNALYFDTVRDGCPECEFFGPGTRYLKLHVARPASRPPAIYVINARTHWAHFEFRVALGLKRDLSLELDRETGLTGTGPEVDTYYWWFSDAKDAVASAGLVPWLHGAIAANLPIMPAEASEWRLAYYIPDRTWRKRYIDRITPRIAGYEQAGVPVLRDESWVVDVSLEMETAVVDEGGTASLLARLAKPLSSSVTVPLIVVGAGTANAVPASVRISAGMTEASTSFATAVDGDTEDEIVTIGFGDLPWQVSPGSPASVTLAVRDLTPAATLAVKTDSLEEGSSTEVEVLLTRAWTSPLLIPLTTSGTVESGDFTVPASVTIAAGRKSGTAAVSAARDADADDETLTVSLGTLPEEVARASPAAVDIVIRDRNTEVTLSAAPSTVEEGESATVTASLSRARSTAVAIPLLVNDVDAEPGDYAAPSFIEVAPNAVTGAAALLTVDDGDLDDETFTVSLGADLPEGMVAGTPDAVLVTIRDDDSAPPPPPESDPPPPPPPPPPADPPPPAGPAPPESDPPPPAPPPAGPPPAPPESDPAPEPEPEPEPAGPLKADFTVDADCSSAPCRLRTGVRVVFSDSSGGRVVGRRWSFGDGSTSRGLSPAHEYRSPGFYEVSLTVSDGTEESVATRVFLVEAGEPAGACVGGASVRCLRDSRFAVEVEWTGPGGAAGAARVVHAGTNDSALFSFFDRANWEVLAKVLDGCAVNGSFWVFAASTTDLEFTIRVTDTATGVSRAYSNEAGAAPAVADAEAFPGACGRRRGR